MKKLFLKRTWLMLMASFFAITSMAQVTSVTVTETGTLWDTLVDQGADVNTVTDLKVTGPIDYTDFRFMRSMMPALLNVDLSDAEFGEVPNDAFRENTHLRSCRLPSTISRISDAAFYHCDALENVAFGQTAFEIGTIVFPASLTSMGGAAFEHCLQLTSVDFSACTSLGIEGFYQCTKLKEVRLPATGSIRFGGNCFLETAIEELTLTPAVNWLEYNSLPNSLKRLVVESKTAYNCSNNAFDSTDKSKLQIWVPQGTLRRYAMADGWFNVNNLIHEYNVKVAITGEGTLLDGTSELTAGSVFLHSTQTELTAQPAEGYSLQSATLNGTALAISGNTITLPTTPVEGIIAVTFVPQTFTLTVQVTGNGTILRNGEAVEAPITLHYGEDATFTLQPAEGLSVQSIKWNGEESVIQNGGLTYRTPAITGDATLAVTFGDAATSDKVQLTVTTTSGGTVQYKGITLDPTTTILVDKNESAVFTIVPGRGMRLDKVLLDGNDVTSQVQSLSLMINGLDVDTQLSVIFTSGTTYDIANPNGGSLFDRIKAMGGNPRDVTKLTISGTMNDTDWTIIKNLMNNLEEIDLSGTDITEVPEGIFAFKAGLRRVKLPQTLAEVQIGAFRDCNLLELVEGGDNIKILKDAAFHACPKLMNIPFGDKIEYLYSYNTMDGCSSLPSTLIMPASLRYLGGNAFAGSSVRTLDLSQCVNLEAIDRYCTSEITTLILPETGSLRLGGYSLLGAQITELTIPASVNRIDDNVMPSTLKRLYVKAPTPIDCDQNAFNDVNLDECILFVPVGSLTDYQLAPGWSNFPNIQEFGLRVKVGSEGKVKVGDQIIIGESGLFLKADETATLQIIPQTGWHVSEAKLNGTAVSVENNRITLNGDQATGTLTISFAINTFDLAVQTIGDGQVFLGEDVIANDQVLAVDSASVMTFTLQPAVGKVVARITFNGEETLVQNGGTTYVTPAITRTSALQVTFSESGEQGDFVAFNVRTGNNGTVEYKNTTLLPETSIQVPKGQDAVFTFKPNPNYIVQSLIMNGEDITDQLIDNKLTIPNVAAAAQMEVTFQVRTDIFIAMEQEGLLSNMINEETRLKAAKLTISGPLNDADFRFMCDELPMLSELDLWDAQCNYIPDEAFCISNEWDNETGKNTLTKVRLPEGTYRIGYRAFAGCTNLSEVNFEDLTELNDIAGWAFTNTGLRRADLSYTRITDLGDLQFRKARKMEYIALPTTITNIGNAFQENSVLTEIDLSNCTNLTNINDAFGGDRKLVRVVLPEGLKSLNGTFNDCQALTNVNFPTSLESIGDNTFFNTRITSADLKPCTNLQRIGGSAFNSCLNLANVTFPTSLQRIVGAAFHQCTALTAVDMSQLSLTEIEGSLFCWCGNLESVKLPKTVVTIRDNAFRGTKLSGILELPASLTTIEHDAFSSTQISVIKIAATNPPALATGNEDGENVFSNNVAAAFVPEGCANRYKEAPVWEDLTILDREVQAEVTVTHEGNLAIDIMEQTGVAPGLITHLKVHGRLNATDFAVMRSNMTLLYDLDMEDANVSVIPENAFLDKKILMHVKLPNDLLVIQENAFKGCSALSGTLILPSGVTTIGWAAFQGCTSLNGIVFSDALEVIRSYAFEGCVNLTQELTFPDQLLSIGEYAFANCRNLFGKVKFNSEFYQFIGAEGYWSSTGRAFENCSNIDEVDLSECEYLYEIPSATFNECHALTTVKLPPYLERIDDYSFHNCTSLTTIAFPQSLLVINREAFNGCSSLRSVDLSNCKSFGTIEGYAFSGCSSLETVNLPKSLNWIQEYAFNECRKLANLNVEALQPADLGEYVFRRVNTEMCVLSIPTGVYYDYLTAAQWGAFVQMRNAIDVIMDEGATLSYTNNADMGNEETHSTPHYLRRGRRNSPSIEQGDAVIKDGTSLYVKDEESVTFFINPDENVSIRQVLFNGEDVTNELQNNSYVTPSVTGASSFQVLLNIDGIISVKELRMTETELAIRVAESHQIVATVYPNNATNKNILWTSSDETVARVSEDGMVTGLKAGRTTITACTEDGNLTQNCELTIMSNDYYVILNDAETFVQNEVRLPLDLHNTDAASGIQFDVYLPEGISMNPYDVQMSGRSNGHSISAAHRSDGSFRVIIYSNDGNAFAENDGELLTLPVITQEDDGIFEVNIKNIHISGPNSYDFVAPDYTARLKVSNYPLGDSNGNGEVTITDVANTVDELLENNPERFIRKAADANVDGIISVSDITATVDIILGRNNVNHAAPRPRRQYAPSNAENEDKLYLNDISINPGQQVMVELNLNNNVSYTAFQCDIFLPEGIHVATNDEGRWQVALTSRKTASHVLSAKLLSNGALRVIAYSMQNEEIKDTEGSILTLILEADEQTPIGESEISIQDVSLVNAINQIEYKAPKTTAKVTITSADGINLMAIDRPQINVDGRQVTIVAPKAMTMHMTSIDGKIRLLQLQAGENRFFIEMPGVYVIDNKKYIIK